MKSLALVFALFMALCVVSEARAGIHNKLWIENDTDYKMHVWANNTDLGWAEPHTSGWVGDHINDHTTTHLLFTSEDGSRTWEDYIVQQVEDYNWVIQQ